MTADPIDADARWEPSGDLSDFTVRDVMTSDILSVGPDMPVAELVQVLAEEGIGGLPVVDAEEVCVGVVSTTDVSRAVLREERAGREDAEMDGNGPHSTGDRERGSAFFQLPEARGASPAVAVSRLPVTRLGARAVRDVMTPATFSVRPEATLPDLSRFLLRSGIHRALVFEDRRLVGVVTATDVLRAVAALGNHGSDS